MARSDFDANIERIKQALDSIDEMAFSRLLDDCESTLRSGHKLIAAGLGKNEPICEKFVGTMLSLGFDAGFLNVSSALHGDLGMVKSGDLVFLLSKSGASEETRTLNDCLKSRPVKRWLITFQNDSPLSEDISDRIVMDLTHEGDLWDIVPNNSTTVNLMVLQEVAIEMSRRFNQDRDIDFAPNHPGGDIGRRLKK